LHLQPSRMSGVTYVSRKQAPAPAAASSWLGSWSLLSSAQATAGAQQQSESPASSQGSPTDGNRLLPNNEQPPPPPPPPINTDGIEGLIPLAVSIELGSKRFWRTKRIIFNPGLMLINALPRTTIRYRQATGATTPSTWSTAATTTTTTTTATSPLHANQSFELPASSSVPLIWPSEKSPQQLQLQLLDQVDSSAWSCCFKVDAPRSFVLGLRKDRDRTSYLRVTITQLNSIMNMDIRDSSSLAIVLSPVTWDTLDYVIENHTRFNVQYQQQGSIQYVPR
jgi:hypothetical protein